MPEKEIKEVLSDVIQRVIGYCSEHYDEYKQLNEDDISYIADKVNNLLIKYDVDFGKLDLNVFDKYDEHTFDCKIPIDRTNKKLKGVAFKKSFEKNVAEYLAEQLISELHLPITPAAPEEQQIKEMEKRSERDIRDIAYAYLDQLYKNITSSNLDINEDELFDMISKLFEIFKQTGIPASKYQELFDRLLVAPSGDMKKKLEDVINILNDYNSSKINVYEAADKVLDVLGIRDHLILEEAKKIEQRPSTVNIPKVTEEEGKPTINTTQFRSLIRRELARSEKPPMVLIFRLDNDIYVVINGEIYLVTDPELYTKFKNALNSGLMTLLAPPEAIGLVYEPRTEDDTVRLKYVPPYLVFNARKKSSIWHTDAVLGNVSKDYNLCLFFAGNDIYVYNNCNLTEEDIGSIYALSSQGYKLVKKKIK